MKTGTKTNKQEKKNHRKKFNPGITKKCKRELISSEKEDNLYT